MTKKLITIIILMIFAMPAIAHAAWVKTSKEPIECTSGYQLVAIEVGTETIYACIPEQKAPAKSDKPTQNSDGPVEGPHFN